MLMQDENSQDLEAAILKKYKGDIDQIIAALKDRELKKRPSTAPRTYGEVIVSLRDISKKYRVGKHDIDALKGVSLEVNAGEYVALTGSSGSGKSTLLQLIGGLDKPSNGSVSVASQNIAKLSDGKLSEFRNKTIGFVFQFFYLQPFLNLSTNLEVPGMFARSKRSDRRLRAKLLAESVALTDRLSHLPNELSGGQMQRAAIARALLNNPKILLADEPTGNLDRENAFAIMELFDTVRETYGTTVIVVTHDAELARRADREIKLQDGKVTHDSRI